MLRKIAEDIYYVGGSDRRLALFENLFPLEGGVSYNSYLLLDEKTVLFDTADSSITAQFLENVKEGLSGRALDFVVIDHMEPDHAASLEAVVTRYPNVKLIVNGKSKIMLKQFFDFDFIDRLVEVADGQTMSFGDHEVKFIFAPMVHWPEVMVSLDLKTKTLFSADAFGTFGALGGNIFADELGGATQWEKEALRYYGNIVGKYGVQVQALLGKVAAEDVKTVCPLHGPIWRENLDYIIDKYLEWSKQETIKGATMVVYASMYGNTAAAAVKLATALAERGIKDIAVYDISKTDVSVIMGEIFRCGNVVLAAPTYNGGLYPKMGALIADLKALNVQNKSFTLIENGSWAPMAAKYMRLLLEELKNCVVLEKVITVRSALKASQQADIDEVAEQLIDNLR